MSVRAFKGIHPRIPASCYIEESAQIIGDVELGEQCSIWFNCVVRGDVHSIRIGHRTNIQDLSVIHVLKNKYATDIGDDVTVGHHVMLHGCHIGNRVLVGMAAVVMDDVEIGDDCLIAAGALLTPGLKVPSGKVVMGSPAKIVRDVTDKERAWFAQSAKNYVEYSREYLDERANPK